MYILHCVLYYVLNTSDLSFPFLLPSLVLSSEKNILIYHKNVPSFLPLSVGNRLLSGFLEEQILSSGCPTDIQVEAALNLSSLSDSTLKAENDSFLYL